MPKWRKPQASPRICLFCDRIANSPEHMWPDWASRHFEKTAHDKSIETHQRIGHHEQTVPDPKIIHGHPTTRKLKYVCRDCNTGWMSRLEQAAKIFIEPMLLGNSVTLNQSDQDILAQWVTLKMMIWEHTDPKGVVFTREQNLKFCRDKDIPVNTRILLFRSEGPWLRNRVGRAYAALFEKPTDVIDVLNEKANMQTVLFGIGELLIFFVYINVPNLEIGEFSDAIARDLFPLRDNSIDWPPHRRVNDDQAAKIIGTLDRFLKRPGMTPI